METFSYITVIRDFLDKYMEDTGYRPTAILFSQNSFIAMCQEVERRWPIKSVTPFGFSEFCYDGIPVCKLANLQDNEILLTNTGFDNLDQMDNPAPDRCIKYLFAEEEFPKRTFRLIELE